jgi:hypothetical protein
MKSRTHFGHRIDMLDREGEIVEHLAGVEDSLLADATYEAALRRWPKVAIIATPQAGGWFKVDFGVSNVRKCYRVQLLVTKWSTVQSKASKGSNFAMGDTSKKSEPAVRRVVWGRQFLASTVVVPPDVAEHLNTDAMAVLAVIRNEAQASGKCSLPVARIAERANIGRAKARAAIRLAEGLGLIAIEETPDRKRVIVNRGRHVPLPT